MKNAAGNGNHRVEGVDERSDDESDITRPGDQEQPDEGVALSGAGASPSGSTMNHWETASPSADATDPASMPHTKSTPLPGETEDRVPV